MARLLRLAWQGLVICVVSGALAGVWAGLTQRGDGRDASSERGTGLAEGSGVREQEDELVQLRQAIAAGTVTLVDARSRIYFLQGHLPGAVNVSRLTFDSDRERERQALLDASREVVVYCGGPRCVDAELVAQLLTASGVKRVRVFAGGVEEWVGAGLGLEPKIQSSVGSGQ